MDDSGDILIPMLHYFADGYDPLLHLISLYVYCFITLLQVRCYFLKRLDNTEFQTTCFEVLYLFTPKCIPYDSLSSVHFQIGIGAPKQHLFDWQF